MDLIKSILSNKLYLTIAVLLMIIIINPFGLVGLAFKILGLIALFLIAKAVYRFAKIYINLKR